MHLNLLTYSKLRHCLTGERNKLQRNAALKKVHCITVHFWKTSFNASFIHVYS